MWLVARATGFVSVLPMLLWPLAITSVLTTCYTGFLFAQARARDLWQGPIATIDLLAQAVAEGAAVLLILAAVLPALTDAGFVRALACRGAMSSMSRCSGEHVVKKSPTGTMRRH
jgi:formate-dependent nitrite reductase membrane component NrfD